MQEPFTYVFLGTIAGSAAATALIVETVKASKLFKRFQTRWVGDNRSAEFVTIVTALA